MIAGPTRALGPRRPAPDTRVASIPNPVSIQATIAPMNTRESARPLREDELASLDELLAAADPQDSMMIEEFDGFCAGLTCSPEAVSTESCLPMILGAPPETVRERLGDARYEQLIDLIGQHRRAVARRLYEGQTWSAVIGTDEEGRALGDAWAVGFLRALSLNPDAWAAADDDEVCVEALELIYRFAHEAGAERDSDDDPDTAGDDEAVEPIADEEREELVDHMLDGVHEIFTRLTPAREQALKPAPIRREAGSAGRNDPCPCGSGRKYKHCHGAS